MFNSSLRRVARSCPNAPSIPSRPGTPTSITASFTSHSHQRRHSSSKPPVPPNNGSPAIPASSVKTVGGPRAKDVSEKSAGAESRLSKRKISREKVDSKQDVQLQKSMNLPSVPSTQHLTPNDVCLASFFSIHRPLSITSPFPAQISSEDFDKIFAPKPKSSKSRPAPSEVIYTITSAVDGLDQNIEQQQQQAPQHNKIVSQRADIISALTQHNDSASNPADPNQAQNLDGRARSTELRVPNGVKVVIQEIARRFRPYNTPPVPVAISDAELDAREAENVAAQARAEANEEASSRALEVQIQNQDQESELHEIVMTVHENVDLQNGQFFTSHGTPVIKAPGNDNVFVKIRELPEQSPKTIGEHIGKRQKGGSMSDRLERRLRLNKMHAISVKRQRRLKMKKHKYKKLMRKTRNLRRRQDKL